jgi:hypothetical protein
MSGFYTWAMRCASAILFTIGLITIVITFGFQLWNYLHMSGGIDGSYGPGSGQYRWLEVCGALVGALSTSILPLFGAALLWRIDRWRSPVPPVPAQEAAE